MTATSESRRNSATEIMPSGYKTESKTTYGEFLEKYFFLFKANLPNPPSPTETADQILARINLKDQLKNLRDAHPYFQKALFKTVEAIEFNKNSPIPSTISKLINAIDYDLYKKAKLLNDPIIDSLLKIKKLKTTFKDTYIVNVSKEIGLETPPENTMSTPVYINTRPFVIPTAQQYLKYSDYISKKSIPTNKSKPAATPPAKQNIWQKTWSWLKRPWW